MIIEYFYMIRSKADLKEYLREDYNVNPDHTSFLKRLLGVRTEKYMIRRLLYFLRHAEYYYNNIEEGGGVLQTVILLLPV